MRTIAEQCQREADDRPEHRKLIATALDRKHKHPAVVQVGEGGGKQKVDAEERRKRSGVDAEDEGDVAGRLIQPTEPSPPGPRDSKN